MKTKTRLILLASLVAVLTLGGCAGHYHREDRRDDRQDHRDDRRDYRDDRRDYRRHGYY